MFATQDGQTDRQTQLITKIHILLQRSKVWIVYIARDFSCPPLYFWYNDQNLALISLLRHISFLVRKLKLDFICDHGIKRCMCSLISSWMKYHNNWYKNVLHTISHEWSTVIMDMKMSSTQSVRQGPSPFCVLLHPQRVKNHRVKTTTCSNVSLGLQLQEHKTVNLQTVNILRV